MMTTIKVKMLVSCIGRQPNSDTWVFNSDLQVDKHGDEIQDHEYYWLVSIIIALIFHCNDIVMTCIIMDDCHLIILMQAL